MRRRAAVRLTGDLHATPRLQSFLGWGGHLDEAALVKPEEPPALLLREILGATPLVEPDGRLVVLRHHEHHAHAAQFDSQLQEGRTISF